MIDVAWRSLETGSTERLHLTESLDYRAVSTVRWAETAVQYEVVTSRDWLFRTLELESTEGSLHIESDGEGGWTVDGTERHDLVDAREIDLQFTPLTNTLPIRRLALGIGDSAEIATAYVSYPSLDVTLDGQRYTRLDEFHYRYEALDRSFSAEITVDDHFLVVDYPGLFERA